jgi:sugar-specific transcriptional regulator TrmB/DNA-binding CsgD family transcriptional regulator
MTMPDGVDYRLGAERQSDAITLLQFLGLETEAGIVYHLMVRHPETVAIDIAERLGWPEPRVRTTLSDLERLGLVRRSCEQPGEVRLVSPAIGLGSIIARREADLSRHEQEVAEFRALTASFVAEYDKISETRPYPHARLLVGLDRVRMTIEELAKDCTTELVAFVTDGPQTKENLAACKPLDQALLERGVRMRSLFLQSVANDSTTLAYVNWLSEIGGEVRTIASLPSRMAIYDRRVALAPIDPDHTSKGALHLEGAGVVSLLYACFDQLWAAGEEWGVQSRPEYGELSGQEREIIRLLSAGNTDAAVARKLGISVRTTRRVIAELADRLGARSRFQVGVLAVQAGWL